MAIISLGGRGRAQLRLAAGRRAGIWLGAYLSGQEPPGLPPGHRNSPGMSLRMAGDWLCEIQASAFSKGQEKILTGYPRLLLLGDALSLLLEMGMWARRGRSTIIVLS